MLKNLLKTYTGAYYILGFFVFASNMVLLLHFLLFLVHFQILTFWND